MTTERCREVQERLPELEAGRLDEGVETGIRAHMVGCRECARAHEVVHLLASVPVAATPPEVEVRMRSAAREALEETRRAPRAFEGGGAGAAGVRNGGGSGASGRRRWLPSWSLAAAAGVVLALGTPLLVQRMQTSLPAESDSSWVAGSEVEGQVQDLLPSAYVGDDAVVAGAPAFDALSDEMLMALLEEME